MKSLKSFFLMSTALMAAGGFAPEVRGTATVSKPEWKPEFSKKELEEIRALPKRERQKRVAELRAKYLKAELGS